MLKDLEQRWQTATNNNAVFLSATERKNVDVLRNSILEKVRTLYKIRYPYKTEYFF
jgi:GTP-binding protein HflX